MKPVMQSICDKGKGDCLRACVASLLELEIEQVPHFIRFGNWHGALTYFLAAFGIQFNGTGRLVEGRVPELEDTVAGLIIATVPSLNFENTAHVVLADSDGCVVHDPSPHLTYHKGRNLVQENILSSWMLLQENVNEPILFAEKLKIGDTK